MPDYRRAFHPGGSCFFTVNLLQRQNNDLLTRNIDLLRDSVRRVRRRFSFVIHGRVVLPDYLHCVIELPGGDTDFPTRWRLIKMNFSKALPRSECRSDVRIRQRLCPLTTNDAFKRYAIKNMSIIDEIKESWGWVGINPIEIVAENDFGNIIIKDAENQFWRLCPEDVYCDVIAKSVDSYNELIKDHEFLNDWNMTVMVAEAMEMLGALKEGYKYCLAIPGVLDGEYTGTNIKTAPFVDIVRFSGNLGKQIKDLPDGAEIELNVMD